MPFDTLSNTENPSTYTEDLTIDASTNALVIGPVVIPNVTTNGNLHVVDELQVSETLTIVGSLNIV
jgi:hypothetical protein